jgi:hypothetical protein
LTASTIHIGLCPHCGNTTPQRIAFVHTYRDVWYSSDGKPSPRDEAPESEAILCICGTCKSVLLYDGLSRAETSGGWPELQYPKGDSLGKFAPANVAAIYREAVRVQRTSPTAFVLLIRKALEGVCDDRRAQGRTLADQLKDLGKKNELPKTLAEVSDVIRVVGNAGAHDSATQVTVPMTWAIDDFFRAVVEYVYMAPGKLKEFKKSLPKLKRKRKA